MENKDLLDKLKEDFLSLMAPDEKLINSTLVLNLLSKMKENQKEMATPFPISQAENYLTPSKRKTEILLACYEFGFIGRSCENLLLTQKGSLFLDYSRMSPTKFYEKYKFSKK